MPNIKLTLNSTAASMIAEVTQKLRDGSNFSPASGCYVKLIGGLHVYDESVVRSALEKALLDAPRPPSELTGTFLEWTMTERDLLLVVDLQGEAFEALGSALVSLLPRGRVFPRPFHVCIGSVKAIDPNERDDFLAAVRSAFPIAAGAAFNCATIEYDAPKPKPPRTPLASRPPKPAAASARVERKARQKAALRSKMESLHDQISGAKQQIAAKYEKVRNDAMDTSGSAIKKQRRRKPNAGKARQR